MRDGAPVPTGPDDAVANVRLVDAVFGAAGLRPRGARARSPMEIRRTPDERFVDLPEWPFAPRYVEIEAAPGSAERLRVHYVDEGPRDADPILCLHGEPSWSYLYRKMIPVLVARGHRVVAPDLIGFGRSDKPVAREAYSYASHLGWLRATIDALALERITLVCQDWGGLLGLRLVAEDVERGAGRFARVVAANTFLPAGEAAGNEAFLRWRAYSQRVPDLQAGVVLQAATTTELPPAVVAAYDAPFPDESYKAGALQFPLLVPLEAHEPEARANARAWQALERFDRPFLTAFSDGDPIMRGADAPMRARIPGAAGQPHATIAGGGHFLQEDRGEALAGVVADWLAGAGSGR